MCKNEIHINKNKINNCIEIISILLVILVANISLSSYFKTLSIEGDSLIQRTSRDFVSLIIAFLAGKHMVRKIDFPLWIKTKKNVKTQIINIVLTTCILSIGTYINNRFFTDITTIDWINQVSSMKDIVFISLRAGIQEEILFRLFGFTFITFIVNKQIKSKKSSIIAGAIISSLFFSLIHMPYIIYPFLIGLVLAYQYYNNGLVAVIVIHSIVNIFHLTMFYLLGPL